MTDAMLHPFDTTHLSWCGHPPADAIDYCWPYAEQRARNLPMTPEKCVGCELQKTATFWLLDDNGNENMNSPLQTLKDDLFDAALQFGRAEECCGKMLVETPINHEHHLRSVAAARLLNICREIMGLVDGRISEDVA